MPRSVRENGSSAPAYSRPKNSLMRGRMDGADGVESRMRPSAFRMNATSWCASAMFERISTMWRSSVATVRRKFLRAGTLKKRSRAQTSVPGGHPAGFSETALPPAMKTSTPSGVSRRRVRMVSRVTAAMLGMASPRNPKDAMSKMSASEDILLVESRTCSWARRRDASACSSCPRRCSRDVTREWA